MTPPVLYLAGLAAVVAGAVRLRRVPGRSDETRWRGFLLLLAGMAVLLVAFGADVAD